MNHHDWLTISHCLTLAGLGFVGVLLLRRWPRAGRPATRLNRLDHALWGTGIILTLLGVIFAFIAL